MDYSVENSLFILVGVSEYDKPTDSNDQALDDRPFIKRGLETLRKSLERQIPGLEKNMKLFLNPERASDVLDNIRTSVENSPKDLEFIFCDYSAKLKN